MGMRSVAAARFHDMIVKADSSSDFIYCGTRGVLECVNAGCSAWRSGIHRASGRSSEIVASRVPMAMPPKRARRVTRFICFLPGGIKSYVVAVASL